MNGMPYSGGDPKSACRLRQEAPRVARKASERGSTGAFEMSRFQSLSGGNIGQPASDGPLGAAGGEGTGSAGAGAPASGKGSPASWPPVDDNELSGPRPPQAARSSNTVSFRI